MPGSRREQLARRRRDGARQVRPQRCEPRDEPYRPGEVLEAAQHHVHGVGDDRHEDDRRPAERPAGVRRGRAPCAEQAMASRTVATAPTIAVDEELRRDAVLQGGDGAEQETGIARVHLSPHDDLVVEQQEDETKQDEGQVECTSPWVTMYGEKP